MGTYGPHKNVAPFSSSELIVHSENNSPMLVVSSLSRLIEVSMWGNLAIEETIDVVHRGAQLKGSFSRYEFQLDTPFPISRGEDKKHFTYLDTTGRTVVVLSTGPGQLLTEAHIQDFRLQFTYPHRTMLAEPLLLVSAFLLLFLLAI